MVVVFKYKKTGAAAYIPHTDVLRSIVRTLRRADIEVNYSQGFRPHANIYMSPPIPLGIESISEYCAVETQMNAEDFLKAYNAKCQPNLASTFAVNCLKNPNIAAHVLASDYYLESKFLHDNFESVVNIKDLSVTGQNGEEKVVSHMLLNVSKMDGGIKVTLNFGNNLNLRIDKYINVLKQKLNSDFDVDVFKQNMYVKSENGLIDTDIFLKNLEKDQAPL